MVDNGDEILADRKRLESENLSPILNRITDAGYDSTEFLKSSDVYKLTSDSTSARDLAAAVQTLGSTANDLTTSLAGSWNDPAKGIGKDAGAIDAAARLDSVLRKTNAFDTNLEKAYSAAASLGNVAETAGGSDITSAPKWTTVEQNQQKFRPTRKKFPRATKFCATSWTPQTRNSRLSRKRTAGRETIS